MVIYSGISKKGLFIHYFQIKLEFRSVNFCEGTKTREPEKNHWSRDKNQEQTQPTYDASSGDRTQATLKGGKRSHHCVITPPLRSFSLERILFW